MATGQTPGSATDVRLTHIEQFQKQTRDDIRTLTTNVAALQKDAAANSEKLTAVRDVALDTRTLLYATSGTAILNLLAISGWGIKVYVDSKAATQRRTNPPEAPASAPVHRR